MKKKIIELTQKLISIPSYVDEKNNENRVAKYIYTYLKSNFQWLKIYKQKVENDRFNLIATNSPDPQIVFISHMDTVKPSGNKREGIKPKTRASKLFGLGSADMKGGLATTLFALQAGSPTKGLALIFDCDEEYYFKGVKKILRKYKFKPKLVVCPEPTGLEIVNGCRGVIEISFEVMGKTAHAGTPQEGLNAIEKAVDLVRMLEKNTPKNYQTELGKTTVNLSALNGGRLLDGEIGVQANAVADIAKVLLDVRPASLDLDAQEVLRMINLLSKDLKVKVQNADIRLDYKPYLTRREKLGLLEQALNAANVKVKYRKDLGGGGFYEAALVANSWQCPAISFGPIGKGHIPNESVDIDSLIKTTKVFRNLVNLA